VGGYVVSQFYGTLMLGTMKVTRLNNVYIAGHRDWYNWGVLIEST